MARDRYTRCEMSAVAEEMLSTVRHDLRNKLGSIANANHYLRKRMQTTELWNSDARVRRFFEIIDNEIAASQAVLEDRAVLHHVYKPAEEVVDIEACIDPAASRARVTIGQRDLAHTRMLRGDEAELTLLVRCVAEYVAGGADAAEVDVRSHDWDDGVMLEIRLASGGGAGADAGGGFGRPLEIARRLCRRYNGALTVEEEGAAVTVKLPSVAVTFAMAVPA